MANIKKQDKQTSRDTRKKIQTQLAKALPDLKILLGEKKFLKRIKKASKLLGDNIKAKSPTKKSVPKKASSKAKKIVSGKTTPAKATV